MSNNDSPLRIRAAQAGDAAVVSSLFVELGFPATAEEVGERLKLLTDAALVAEVGGKVVGVVTTNVMGVLHRPTPVGRISTLVVTGKEQKKGIGRALVAAAEAQLQSRGCGLVEITSNFRLESAHAFYAHLGYQQTSLRFKKDL